MAIGLKIGAVQQSDPDRQLPQETDPRNLNDTWMYMPDGDGKAQVAYLTEPPQESDKKDHLHQVPQYIQFEFNGR